MACQAGVSVPGLEPIWQQQNSRLMKVKGTTDMKTWIAIITTAAIGFQAWADDGTLTNAGNASSLNATTPMFRNYADDMSGRFGLGIMMGEPTGLSWKYFLNHEFALDGGLGWSFRDETDPHLHADLLWHKFDLIPVPEGQLPVYVGVGGRVKFRDNREDRVGIRFPVGISYLFDDLPMDAFFEFAPIIDFAPSTRGGFNIGAGVRWWF
jgi:hypothetical protein